MRTVLQRLIEAGIAPDTPLDVAIARRANNLCALMATVLALASAAASYFDAGYPPMAGVNLVLALAYFAAVPLSAVGSAETARWLVLATGCAHFFSANVAFGASNGFAFYILILIGWPLVAFTRAERDKTRQAHAAILVTCVATAAVLATRGPSTVLPAGAAERAYYVILAAVVLTVGFGFHHFKNSSVTARVQLDDANRRISELIRTMVPPAIASRLERGDRLIAQSHGEGTVLFADLIGFSDLARRLSPTHLVEVLNLVFSRFDEAAAARGIEKIKTIGDCYMAATGVLDDDPTGRVHAMAEFALDMLGIVERTTAEIGIPLGMRVGISTGPVISGVIGTHRFTFDVWGDTVNLANRMESSGHAGHIQVSEATYWRLQSAYTFDVRGEVEVKGGQRVRAYVLTGRRAA